MANDINFKVKADTSKATAGARQINNEFAKAGKSVEDTNKALKDGGNQGSRFGKVVSGIKFGAGFAAGKGILDKVLGSLVENEKVANLFSDALSIVSGVAEGLAEIMTPAFEAIGNAIQNPKKAWDSIVDSFQRAGNWIKKNLIDGVLAFFEKQLIGIELAVLSVKKAWNDWTGDVEESEEVHKRMQELQKRAEQIDKDQAKRWDEIKAVGNEVINTFVEMGKTIAKNVEKTVKGNKALRETANAYITLNAKIEENIKSLERQMAQNEATANNETKTFDERRKAIENNLALKKQMIEEEKKLIQNQINLLALENQAKGVSAERTAQMGALRIQMQGLDATIQETQLTIDETLRGITEQQKESIKAVSDATLERSKAEAEATANLQAKEHEKIKATLDAINIQKQAFLQAYDERLAKETEGTAKYNEILAERIAKEGEFNSQRIQLEGEYNAAYKDYQKEQKQLALEAMQVKAGALQQGLNLAKTLMADDAEMQSAIAIAEAIMQTYVGANVALASSPPPLNFINMAGVIAGGLANVIKIRQEAQKMASQTGASVPGGGGGGGVPQIGPSVNIAKGNVMDSNMQLKDAMSQANRPPRAYVVQGDIASAESLSRKIMENATLGP